MSSIFKGLNEAFDVQAMQAEYQQRKQDIEANKEAYSEKYGIPLDHPHFVGAVMGAQNNEEQKQKQKERDEIAQQARAKGVASDKANVAGLKKELTDLEAKFDPNFEYSDDYTFWNEQKRIQSQIQGLKKRIKDASEIDEAKEADYGADYQAMVKRVGQMAKEGPRKTVWDPVKRVYKTVPVNPPKKESVEEASPETTFNTLKGLKSWQVVIMNNYYRGKYSDYSGRYYYVLASSPEEAKQVVLDNADAILQDLLSMKSVNGKKILPRGSAVRITADRIGEIKDGTEAGRMTTMGYKKMFGPQGPMMVKLNNGAIADVQGQEQGVAEGFLGDREYNRVMPFVKRIAGEVSDYDRDEFGEELWSLLDQKYGSKFAQSVLDDLDFYWDTYTELTGQGLDEASVYKKDQDLSGVSTQELEAFVRKHWFGGIPTYGQGESVKRAMRELKRRQKQGVAEGYIFKGGFPFDVDHMPGSVIRNRDETTDVVKTKNKDKWDDEVDRINDEVFDDMSEFRTDRHGETVTGNSAVWAKWDNATQTGWINRKGHPLKPWPVKEQGVEEGYDKWGWHTSLTNGEFMPTKYGNKNYVYLHDLDNESPRGGPQLVTVNKPTVAKRIAKQFGGKVVKTDLNTYRVVKPAVQGVEEDWQKVNKSDKTDGMSRKAVKAYRRENPGSKLKTAVTKKPKDIKKGSSDDKRRKSFCARMKGMKKAHASAKTKRDPDSPINKALRRWHCESVEQMQELVMLAEQKIQEAKNAKQQAAIAIAKKKEKMNEGTDICSVCGQTPCNCTHASSIMQGLKGL